MKKQKKIILIILDGWGIGKKNKNNPIEIANLPNMDSLNSFYPHSKLSASGPAAGLPAGVMGNSEVGHLNLGAGRTVYQDLVKINKACSDGSLAKNKILLEAMKKAKVKNKALHLIGLVSDAGVHSHIKHLYKLCELAGKNKVDKIFVHAISDGRDTDPKSGLLFIKKLKKQLVGTGGKIATVVGRYYAMDRDRNWERIKKSYDAMVGGLGEKVTDIERSLRDSYQKGITDEFMKPKVVVDASGFPIGQIKPNDVVICFNFRTERLRELTMVLTQKNMPGAGMKTIPLHYYTLTKYDDYKGVKVIFEKDNLKETLGEILAKNRLSQLRLAETEKYAHVTYFFSGGRDQLFKGEKRILIKSPRVATYDLQPEMSAPLLAQVAVKAIKRQSFDFICMNFANGDMVGHTGNFSAIVKALEAIDSCLGMIIAAAQEQDYEIMIIADHGNAETAVNVDGSINTAHSLNPVPCILVSNRYKKIRNGSLADVAPTILKLMNIKQPKVMTGRSLV